MSSRGVWAAVQVQCWVETERSALCYEMWMFPGVTLPTKPSWAFNHQLQNSKDSPPSSNGVKLGMKRWRRRRRTSGNGSRSKEGNLGPSPLCNLLSQWSPGKWLCFTECGFVCFVKSEVTATSLPSHRAAGKDLERAGHSHSPLPTSTVTLSQTLLSASQCHCCSPFSHTRWAAKGTSVLFITSASA